MEQDFIKNGGYFEKCKAGSLFTIKGNPQLDKEYFVFSKNSEYPYFTRTVFNNGIYGYVDFLDNEHLIKGNSLAVGMMGMKFFYMPHDFYAGQFTKTAFPKFEGFNSRIALWFISWFNKSSQKYLNVLVREFEDVFNETEIIVPRHKNGKLALDFMQARIQEMEQARIQEMDTYLKVAGFEDCELTEEETSALRKMRNGLVGFKAFYVTDDKASHKTNGIFHVNNSHNILQSSILAGSGSIPYVTAGESNNSVSAYISYDRDLIEKGNSIMIGGKTMVITYQAEDFFSNDSHNLVLYAKDDNLRNELIQLFLVTSLSKSLKPIYSWGDSISKAKIKKDKLRLPVTASGEIDYHFMETYIRAQEKLAIQRVKDWREKEIATTKEVVEADTVRPTSKKKRNARFIYISSSEIVPSQRYTTRLPVYPLRAACGYFDECGSLPEEEAEGWIDASGIGRKLNENMFVVHAEGKSMEPKIYDGDLCIFEKTAGSHQGKIVLAKAKDELDPEAGSYTIKKYSSEKSADEDGRNIHTRIVLLPLNQEFQPIVLEADKAEEGEFQVYGELVQVIQKQ